MFNPAGGASAYMPSLETAARSLKVEPIIAPVHSDTEIETAITALGREPGGGLVVVPGGFMAGQQAPIISAAARTTSRRSFGYLSLPETAARSPTDLTQ
jgi:putative ABC transport system substrate-binding protein